MHTYGHNTLGTYGRNNNNNNNFYYFFFFVRIIIIHIRLVCRNDTHVCLPEIDFTVYMYVNVYFGVPIYLLKVYNMYRVYLRIHHQ